jgi:hypothetical protein
MMQKATIEPASAPAGKHSPQSVPLATSEARTKDEKNRTMKTQPWLEGGGLAMLYLLPLIAIFLAPEQNGFYHQVMPVTSLTRGAFIDLLLVGFVFGAGLAWLSVVKSRLLQRLFWIPVLFLAAWATERGLTEFFRNISVDFALFSPGWMRYLPWIVLASVIMLLLFARRYYDITVKAAEVFLMSAGIAAVFVVLPRLAFACFNHAPPEQASFNRPVSQPWRPGEPRVVWVLFDELSYDQVFDHRQRDVELPAFTKLKEESLSFSQLAPEGNLTELVIPSLFLGRPVTEMRSNRSGELLWRSGPQKSWQHFQPDATVFAAARAQGWGTGVVGWYNPYCRLLEPVLDRCYWTYQEFAQGGRFSHLSSQRSVLENARDALPLMAQLENAWHHTSSNQSHKDDYESVLKEATLLVEDENIRFAFIHLPVPHPPGIFPNPDHSAKGKEDYLGNLILADQALSALRSAISKTSAASDTIFIASSDHSWRVPMWRGFPGWSRAEEQASNGGSFDQRPVLMIHLPGETGGEFDTIDRPQNAMILHSLLLDIFTGKIRRPQELKISVDAASAVPGPQS